MANQVKFARNKTEEQAIAGDSSTVYFSTDKQSIVMGGKVYGGSLEQTKKEYLDKLYEDYVKGLFKVTSSISKSTVEPNTEVTVTVNVKNNDVAVTADSISGSGFLSGVTLTESTTNPGTYTATVVISKVGTSTGLITVVYGDLTATTSVSVSCYNKIIYGWSTLSEISSYSDLVDPDTVGPQSSVKGSYTFANTSDGWYYIMIPTGTSIGSSLSGSNPQGTEGPIPVFFVKQTSTEVTGYTVFRIADKQGISTHTITFS